MGESMLILTGILRLIREVGEAATEWEALTCGGERDLTPEEFDRVKGKVDAAYAGWQGLKDSRGIG